MDTMLTDVMSRLRDATRPHHDRAEHHPFQRALAKGQLPLAQYVGWLGQMRHVHERLEAHLDDLAAARPEVRDVLGDDASKLSRIDADLACLGAGPTASIPPLPETANVLRRLDESVGADPLRALGMHYVLEGATNGGHYIAMNVAPAYGFEDGRGVAYLDPYGERQREVWSDFKRRMGGVAFSEDEVDRLVHAAAWMFDAIATVSDGLDRMSI
ncbi:MAG: biliverdin-producing heme oxygenase [Phycisphaerales bacterium]